MSGTAYHTTSAFVKSKIASAFEKGDYVGAGKLLRQAMKVVPVVGAIGAQKLINAQR